MSLYRDFFFWKNRILLKIYIGNAFSRQAIVLHSCQVHYYYKFLYARRHGVLQASSINICQGTDKGFSYSTFPCAQQFNMLGVGWLDFTPLFSFAPTEMDNIVTICRYQLLELYILKLNSEGNKSALFNGSNSKRFKHFLH